MRNKKNVRVFQRIIISFPWSVVIKVFTIPNGYIDLHGVGSNVGDTDILKRFWLISWGNESRLRGRGRDFATKNVNDN